MKYFDKAANLFKHLIKYCSNNYLIYYRLGLCYLEMEKKENEFNKEKEMIMNKNALNDQKINAINAQNNKIIEELKMKIII